MSYALLGLGDAASVPPPAPPPPRSTSWVMGALLLSPYWLPVVGAAAGYAVGGKEHRLGGAVVGGLVAESLPWLYLWVTDVGQGQAS